MKTTFLMKGICTCLLGIGSLSLTSAQQLQDDEVKINVAKITNSVEKLKNLQPVTFHYNTEKFHLLDFPSGNRYGFLIRDMKHVFPEMLQTTSKVYSHGKNTTKTVRYEDVDHETLVPILVAAIKEQQEQIESLKQEIEKLQSK